MENFENSYKKLKFQRRVMNMNLINIINSHQNEEEHMIGKSTECMLCNKYNKMIEMNKVIEEKINDVKKEKYIE
ncbi:hypothetical protein ACQ3MN_07725 [Enterococcus faecalis]|uniref:hypothetical protein n=1 Tax=Enterococcus faecalis TaxID=1351 RepID=UPI003D784C66